MILSMTGYGKSELDESDVKIIVETRSLNSKFLDLRLKMPSELSEKELEIRQIVKDAAIRGKIDMTIELQANEMLNGEIFKKDVFRAYLSSLKEIADEFQLDKADLINAVLRIPNVLEQTTSVISDKLWELLKAKIKDAVDALMEQRRTEGVSIENDLKNSLKEIELMLNEVNVLDEDRLTAIRSKMNNAVSKYLNHDKVDESRLEQEILYYLEKMDINEEKVRLQHHIDYFIEILYNSEIQIGKKLNFICQEMGREINTLGAKAYSSDIQKYVVQMKNELEKIKEQLANAL